MKLQLKGINYNINNVTQNYSTNSDELGFNMLENYSMQELKDIFSNIQAIAILGDNDRVILRSSDYTQVRQISIGLSSEGTTFINVVLLIPRVDG